MILKYIKRTFWINERFIFSDIFTVQADMHLRFVRALILFITTLVTVPVQGDLFMGVKVGRMMVDVPSGSDPTNLAVNLGYEIDTHLADVSLTGEINRTMSSGETNQSDELEFKSDGIYIVFKTSWPLFVTFRGGVVKDEIIAGSGSRKGDGISFGGGFGIVAGKTRLQIEYTSIAGDANFLSLGLDF